MSKVYRVTKTVTASVRVYGDKHEVQFRNRHAPRMVAFDNQADADRALAALAREFGLEEVTNE